MKVTLTIECPDLKSAGLIEEVAMGTGATIDIHRVDETPTPAKKRSFRFVNGKRNKGVMGIDLVRDTLTARPKVTRAQLMETFTKHEFAPSSISSLLSKAVRAGWAKRNDDDTWSLIK